MFELSFIKKYLTPKRKQLSVSLIALLSVTMITLVVWLLVVFLSVTEGIEKNWLKKLTALNAPVRLKPTEAYFQSYYYAIDSYAEESGYMAKTIGQKARALISDPYNPDIDQELPPLMAKPDCTGLGNLKDPVKEAFSALSDLSKEDPSITYQDVEVSGALLRLNMLRKESSGLIESEFVSQLTNVSYLASFPDKNPSLEELLIDPSNEDIDHLLLLGTMQSNRNEDSFITSLQAHAHLQSLTPRSEIWPLPINLLPEKTPILASCYVHNDEVTHVVIPTEKSKGCTSKIERRGDRIVIHEEGKPEMPLPIASPLYTQGPLSLSVIEVDPARRQVHVHGTMQGQSIDGFAPLNSLKVQKVITMRQAKDDTISPIWPYQNKEGNYALPKHGEKLGILVAKNFREKGVRLGDDGSLSYSTTSLSGPREQQIPIYVAGFYDPGIMAVGNRFILVPSSVTTAINASQSAFTVEPSESNSILVWFPNLQQSGKVKESILQKLQEREVDRYWVVETFHEYSFARDLLQQFSSDKYLFSLIGVIILLVACTNIISLLVLLVSDKKKEIGILRAMGASKKSIAGIFAICGASLGLFSCFLGTFLAWITLQNIDSVVTFLSAIQGQQAFNPQFFGENLPKAISPRALSFVAVATPLLALIAGVIPAIKASRLNPCQTLRSE